MNTKRPDVEKLLDLANAFSKPLSGLMIPEKDLSELCSYIKELEYKIVESYLALTVHAEEKAPEIIKALGNIISKLPEPTEGE